LISLETLKQRTNYLVHLDKFVSFDVIQRQQGLELLHYGICNLPGECWMTVNAESVQQASTESNIEQS